MEEGENLSSESDFDKMIQNLFYDCVVSLRSYGQEMLSTLYCAPSYLQDSPRNVFNAGQENASFMGFNENTFGCY